VFAVLAATAPVAAGDDALWAKLREGGYVVLVRHARTDPGVGDPPGFRLDDCATQRNLDAAGREEAARLGAAFKRERVPVAQVLSSEWCRCRDTASLAFGRYETWSALNNLFTHPGNAPAQKRDFMARAAAFKGPGNLLLVTHGATVLEMTGISPGTAELVVTRPGAAGKLDLVGRMPGR
jgi:phosphohistidine phosphatase SixA